MWKKTALTLLLASLPLSAQPPTEKMWRAAEIAELQQQWQTAQTDHWRARENFLQLERLLNAAIKEKRVSATLLTLAEQLKSPNYPLAEEADWLLLKAKLSGVTAQNVETLVEEIAAFSATYPSAAKRYQLAQLPISLYFEQGNTDALLRYVQTTAPMGIENQCRVLNAQEKQLSTKLAGELADTAKIELDKLIAEFEKLWLNAPTTLPMECRPTEQRWIAQGGNSHDKLKQKALRRFSQNQSLSDLQGTDEGLTRWINALEQLRLTPNTLPNFAENQPLDENNKAVVLHAFSAFIKSQPEQMSLQDWQRYQGWAQKFQLSEEALHRWKITFLNRAFDNDNPEFQRWRDEQLIILKADNLTERRLRMAIWQKTDLRPWLALLSSEAQAKQEWRYWLAKSDTTQRAALLTALSQERGFYPMLAAEQLGTAYQVKWQTAEGLTDEEQQRFQPELDRIAELRVLKWFEQAKTAWIELLQAVDFKQKLALSDYASRQDWYDLAVEGTILAKAWDYIPLRLPNAYADWFKLHLQDKAIRPHFAMAIARQESAWNPQARSHANALGLMQMLPSTAKQTAENSRLPFTGEQDLLQPFQNIMFGTAHLNELNQKYPKNRILIAAAYNAGSHRVERWLKRANGRLEMDEFIASIPFVETRGYVQNVLAYDYYYQILQQQPNLLMFSGEEKQRY